MKIDNENFDALVARALADGNVAHMRPVVEKELLHYDILFSLEKEGMLNDLTFQGGTSLRLCHGANRFSEDLDFAGGKEFSAAQLAEMKECIEAYIGGRYGLEVIVKEPSQLKKDPKYTDLKIDKWQIAVVTSPERKDIPRQKIKLEVANVPAYTREPLPMGANYDFLPDGYEDTLIMTETLDEVMADKLVSLPATQNYVRNRDIWDLSWLKQQGAQIREDLVQQKLNDYGIEGYEVMLGTMIGRIPEIVAGNQFKDEMRRFTPSNIFERTLGQEKFEHFLVKNITQILKGLQSQISGRSSPEFVM
ncbi:MAG: nucleotidyl transferase AbiEii/AbiGii toxin family protein [Xanthomonadales bacterium]|nr:nucleotidyl transferase AbiEii/AbiGii toxin family protein [Xanthomonadales bacterium]